MHFYSVLAILSCVLALCHATYVQVSNLQTMKIYEVFDTRCYKTDQIFEGNRNQVLISGYPTTFFANDDCTYTVGMSYWGTASWQFVLKPIRSFRVEEPLHK
ncbi:hypothetical protein IWW39_002999 [Coemansia spiralis]|uniref:Uncharacterized protein n=2 Tax=Coemansia TaxID=4863 RepID=A0A9W8L4T1_9FUNG|nr:hypothetical protein GGI06_000470 [Coemansia sp. S85]KAJ2687357.1 hypothetical protein IWW39_002999 [Coemansia spiralis]